MVLPSNGFCQDGDQGLEARRIAEVAQVVAGHGADVVGRLPTGRDVFHARDRDGDVVGLVEKEGISDLVEQFGRGQTRE